MTSLGNYNHDFPRLAKQSGFYFQSHKGKVNWREIENLNINEITENRNFQLLEQNLINVVNCNLEEFNPKLLDENFIKLFRLAQLGIDYLSYCETYLDKCVVILQEQLIAIQEDFESLKYERERKKENGNKSKRKNKTLSYQCEKCEKAFISDVYLKFHDKRRHSVPNSPKSVDTSPKNYINNHERKSSTFTQTENFDDNSKMTKTQNETSEVKLENTKIQIGNLEQEVKELKERLKKAENALTDKNETFKNPFPGQMCHNTMLLLLPSHQTQLGCHEINSGNFLSNLEILQPQKLNSNRNLQTTENQTNINENSNQFPPEKNVEKIENEFEKEEKKSEILIANTQKSEECKRKQNENLENDKENIDPIGENHSPKLCKPLPPPRKSKMIPTKSNVELKATEQSEMAKNIVQSEIKCTTSHSVVLQCTPMANDTKKESLEEIIEDVNEQESASNKSFNSSRDTLVEDGSGSGSGSFFKMILKKNSPKFRMLGKNLRKSLNNICDSVSSSGKDSKDSIDDSIKGNIIDGLNRRLRQLGVDPEWSGIPRKTMRQKLKALKHRRKFLAKENPMYPVVRENIEEKIFQKLKKNIDNKKANFVKKLSKESVTSDNVATCDSSIENAPEREELQSCVMYDIESESESKTSESEIDINEVENKPMISIESDRDLMESKKEFDLSVFQVGKGSFNKITTEKEILAEDVESESDGDFLEEEFKALNGLLSDEIKDEEERRLSVKENQSILKGPEGFQSRLQLNTKKKVWFVSEKNFETPLTESSSDDSLWPLKNDNERDVG